MPNWCMNDLTVTGPKKEIAKFKEQSKKDHTTKKNNIENFFAQFVPIPNDIFRGNVGQKEEALYGDKTWYTWCPRNWGTKWDANGCVLSVDKPDQLIYVFDTAWSPPIAWLEKVATLYPKLQFEMNYDEPGMVFSGTAISHKGRILNDERNFSPSNDEMQDEENLEEARNLEKSK